MLAFTTRQDAENPFLWILGHLTDVCILPVAEKLPSSCLQATVASLVSNPGAATRYVEPPKPSTSAAIDRKEPIFGSLIVKVVELKFPPMRIIIAYHCYMKQYHQITFADKPECNFMLTEKLWRWWWKPLATVSANKIDWWWQMHHKEAGKSIYTSHGT